MQQRNDWYWHVIAFVTVVIWGSTFISTKILLMNGLTAAQIFTFRFLIAYILMLAFSHDRWWTGSLRDEGLMALLGMTGGSAYFLTENMALEYSTATNVSLIVCSCPLFATIMFCLFFKEIRLTAMQWLGTLLAFLGMVVVVLNGHFVLRLSPLGDTLALFACLCWAVYSIVMKFVVGRYSSAFITRKVFFYGLLTILPYHLLVPESFSWSLLARFPVLFNLLFLGCIASMLCFLTWTWVMRHLGAIRATNYVYVNPMATLFFATWILDERITYLFLIGSAMILTGLYLSNKQPTSDQS